MHMVNLNDVVHFSAPSVSMSLGSVNQSLVVPYCCYIINDSPLTCMDSLLPVKPY